MLSTRRITDDDDLAALERPWNRLAGGTPLGSWTWLNTWWTHYAATNQRLHVIAVYDDTAGQADQLIGVAPWYLDASSVRGRVIRPLGSGEVCTDHLSLVCDAANVERVAEAIAEFLATKDDGWDRLELDAVDADDAAISRLADELSSRGCLASRVAADNCWAIDLPATWEEFIATQSKSHRKQLRRFERRVLDSDRVAWHLVQSRDEFDHAWRVLVDLHQRRRQSLGQPGCFASQRFHDFHRDVAQQLLDSGQLRLSWLALDGAPIAAEYHVAGGGATYAYQGGVDPTRLDDEPGRLSNMLTIQQAIQEGHRQFDFLRGDEPYKAHWRAKPRAAMDYRIVANRRSARWRGCVLGAAEAVTDWVKQTAHFVTG